MDQTQVQTTTPVLRPAERAGQPRRGRGFGGGVNWWLTALLIVLSLSVLFPLYLAVVTALKSADDPSSVVGLPVTPRWSNFGEAITLTDFPRALLNTSFITVFTVILTLLTNSMVAYAVARNMDRSRLFKGLYFYFIAALFVPFQIIMLPVVKQTSLFGLNSPIGLIFLYVVYGLSFNIFVYVGYLKSIPRDLEEAAKIDGATTWQTFWRIIFPLLTPINATVGIITTLWAWNDFLLPLVILSERTDFTLPLTQFVFQSQFTVNYNLAFASYLMAMAPLLIVYVFAQRWIIGGVTSGAVK
jgi:raffinose/stachyose/melibiose transport system permease protein